MYIAMNQFRIVKGQEAASEKVCADRDCYPGLRGFAVVFGCD